MSTCILASALSLFYILFLCSCSDKSESSTNAESKKPQFYFQCVSHAQKQAIKNLDVDILEVLSSNNDEYLLQFEGEIVKIYDMKKKSMARIDTLYLIPKSEGDNRKRLYFMSNSKKDGQFMINS